jgi:hypothetical protein
VTTRVGTDSSPSLGFATPPRVGSGAIPAGGGLGVVARFLLRVVRAAVVAREPGRDSDDRAQPLRGFEGDVERDPAAELKPDQSRTLDPQLVGDADHVRLLRPRQSRADGAAEEAEIGADRPEALG